MILALFNNLSPSFQTLRTKIEAFEAKKDQNIIFFSKVKDEGGLIRVSWWFWKKVENQQCLLIDIMRLHLSHSNLVQESTFCTIMVRLTFYPSLISSKMISWKFHACISMANHHKCPHNYTLPYRGSNFQSDFFAILIADSDFLQKTTWRKCLSFLQILSRTPSKLEKSMINFTLP